MHGTLLFLCLVLFLVFMRYLHIILFFVVVLVLVCNWYFLADLKRTNKLTELNLNSYRFLLVVNFMRSVISKFNLNHLFTLAKTPLIEF